MKYTYIFLLFTTLSVICPSVYSQESNDFKGLINISAQNAGEDNEKAIEASNQAYILATELKDNRLVGKAYSSFGYIAFKMRDYKAAYDNYKLAIEFMTDSDSVDIYNLMNANHQLAIISNRLFDYDNSISFYKEALNWATVYKQNFPDTMNHYGDDRFLIDFPYHIALNQKNNGQVEQATNTLLAMWNDGDYAGDTTKLVKVLNQIGLLAKRSGDTDLAIEFFGMAYGSNGTDKYRAMAAHNLANSYWKTENNIERARVLFEEAINLKSKSKSTTRSKFLTFLDAGELEYTAGNNMEAIALWNKALNVYDKPYTDPETFVIYSFLTKAYAKVNSDSSLQYAEYFHNATMNWTQTQKVLEVSQQVLVQSSIFRELYERQIKEQNRRKFFRLVPLYAITLLVVVFLIITILKVNRRVKEQRLEYLLQLESEKNERIELLEETIREKRSRLE